ncbi:hypothetical protein [Nocardia donostiensis]|uniref:hypothetical protein n=1 Tax=Nocardia donostiensis TaxID=1538463 RepID=UPI0020CA438A|nr:hypothetical protein [Nocardia donostiensis]
MHAYIDESKRGDYILCAVTILPTDVDPLRKQMRDLCPKGSSRIHMKSAGKAAAKIVTEVSKLDVESRLYIVKSRKLSERAARNLTLGAAARDLAISPVRRVVIESCNQDREDRLVIRDTLGPCAPFDYLHDRPTEPLLWLPDVHA